MVKLNDILPLIPYNDIRIATGDEEICLIRKGRNLDLLSNKYLNAEVDHIDNEEEIVDTINIYIIDPKED